MRSIAKQSPAIVISLIALTYSLGSGAGWAASDATTHPAKAAPKPTWHALSLKNQWKSAAKGYDAARPQYTIVNDVVLHEFLIDPALFRVTVADGVVTVVGAPETADLGHNLMTRIRKVRGVVAVHDELSYPPAERSIAGLYF